MHRNKSDHLACIIQRYTAIMADPYGVRIDYSAPLMANPTLNILHGSIRLFEQSNT